MREIKFRAWDKADKCMNNVLTMEFDNEELIKVGYTFDGTDNLDNSCLRYPSMVELMQYTGLKDKNGVEIYEGDIVRVANYQTDWKRGEPDFNWRVFEIQWNRYTWAFNNSVMYSPLSDYDTGTAEPYDIEVIGNIHENPELLK